MRVDIDVDLDDRIPEILIELPVKAERVEERVAEKIATVAGLMAPRLNRRIHYPSFRREPGWLAGSISADRTPTGEMSVNVGAFWGVFQEYGTEHHSAQPFLEPAAIANELELIDEVHDMLEGL